ncbi:MAG: ThuA domain-containing protein [Saprospiraceae bacterium]|nr:ThuA domain-containing protein [Saprospiraceae bacterium]
MQKIKFLVLIVLLLIGTNVFSQITPAPTEPHSRIVLDSILSLAPPVSEAHLRDLHIVLLACEKDHGPYEHDYPLWQKNWSLLLGGSESGSEASQINLFGLPKNVANAKKGAPNVTISTAWKWPSAAQFEQADLVVAFSVIEWDAKKNADAQAFLSRGGGLVLIHQSCVVPDHRHLADEVASFTGLAWNWDISRWRHGPMNLEIANPDHPICLGLPQQLYFMDEAYWPLHGDRSKVDIIATSKETDKIFALRHEDGTIDFTNMGAIQQKWPTEPTKDEPMFWTYRFGKGRVYGCILGHYSWTFDDPYFRLLLLRGMAWAANESPYRFDALALRAARLK